MNLLVNQIETAYDDEGEGKTVLLLHGWGTNRENFTELRNALRQHYRVLSLDLPGFGETAKPSADWRVSDYAKFVAKFLNLLGIDDVYALVVHSFGGRIAIKGLSMRDFRAEKLVLIDAAGIGHSKSLRNMAFALVAKTGKVVMSLPGLRGSYNKARRKLHEQAGSEDYAQAGDMQQIFLKVIHEDLREEVKLLSLPTLVIWGSEDNETPLSDARYFHDTIPGSILKIVQGAGHFVHNERPEKVVKFIEEFLG